MAEYVHFTDEQKQRANSVDLVDFLRRQGEQLIRSGREWRWKRHDSVTIRGNRWFRHSAGQGGLAIDFVQEFYGLSFPDAVTLLLGGEQGVEFKQTNKNDSPPKRKEFLLPEAADNMRRVYAYLLKQRYIDRDVLTHFVTEKKIYEDKEYHNVVFVGCDENGTARHAHKGEPIPMLLVTVAMWKAQIQNTVSITLVQAVFFMYLKLPSTCCHLSPCIRTAGSSTVM